MAGALDADNRTKLIATGRRTSASLAQTVVDKPADTPIETNAGSLRGLAQVINALVEDADRCGGVDCMGRSLDGVKLWVTQDRLKEVERRAKRYEAALRAIAGAIAAHGEDIDLLIDWQGTACALADAAERALQPPTG